MAATHGYYFEVHLTIVRLSLAKSDSLIALTDHVLLWSGCYIVIDQRVRLFARFLREAQDLIWHTC